MRIIDLHCDTLSELRDAKANGEPASLRENKLHIDANKLRAGDFLLQTFASFVNLGSGRDPLVACLELIDLFYTELEVLGDVMVPVKAYADIERAMNEGKISALLSVEEGGVCKGELSVLRMLYRLGVRMMSITWNYPNELGHPNSVPGEGNTVFPCAPDTEHGLTERGIEFLHEMERLGMIIDVSHLSDAGFWDVAANTAKPFIASHSNSRVLCRHCRNLTDDMIKVIAERGGIIGINYCSGFLEEAENEDDCRSTVAGMVSHMKQIAKVGGVGVLSLGSDFDGITRNLEMYNASCLGMLYDGIIKGGFTSAEADMICHGNALRLFRELL